MNDFPSAKVIAHSAAPNGEELITMEIELHRFILPEFNTHRCLVADTELWFDLPKGSDKSNKRLYKMSIGDFYNKWSKGATEHKVGSLRELPCDSLDDNKIYKAKSIGDMFGYSVSSIRTACRQGKCKYLNTDKKRNEDFLIKGRDFKSWRSSLGKRTFNLQSRLENMRIRMLNEGTNEIQNTNITDIWEVGEKETYTVKVGDFEITGTEDHPLLTVDGWKEIRELTEDDYVLTCGSGVDEYSDSETYKKINGKWTTVWNRQNKSEVLCRQNRVCDYCNESLEGEFDIHHLEPVHKRPDLAFELDNVVAVHKDCHKKLHSSQGWQKGNKLIGKPVKVDYIKYAGKQKVYDLSVKSDFHNFIANGVVVHNCFSRNFQSSRAVPVEKMIEQVRTSPAMPVHWGKNQRGMVAEEINHALIKDNVGQKFYVHEWWKLSAEEAADAAQAMHEAGYHKQIVNRLLEPFMKTKGVVTATKEGFESFFKLRSHKDAQPEIKALSDKMKIALEKSIPNNLNIGEYHLPYIGIPFSGKGAERLEKVVYEAVQNTIDIESAMKDSLTQVSTEDLLYMNNISLKDAVKISTSCCAQVSYRVLDESLSKAEKIYNMLNLPEKGVYLEDPPHFSPTEHVAVVMEDIMLPVEFLFGKPPVCKNVSGNFQSQTFGQYRKFLECGKEGQF